MFTVVNSYKPAYPETKVHNCELTPPIAVILPRTAHKKNVFPQRDLPEFSGMRQVNDSLSSCAT